MSIKKADSAGFCFGVNRAINIVNELLEKGIKVATLGPIIHNMEMVHELEERGCTPVEAVDELTDDTTLVIRSHGVEKSVIDSLVKRGINFEDATCPFVKKIHKIVSNTNPENDIVLIAGNKNHPEVCGIIGHCASDCYTFNNEAELDDLLPNILKENNKRVQIVAQTTFDTQEWKKCVKKIKKLCTNAKIFDTICSVTEKRQTEAVELSRKSDIMLVIGGKESSNTAKLVQVCEKNCHGTFWIQTSADLSAEMLGNAKNIGITAGASTPDGLIQEVKRTMSEIMKEENFADLFAKSCEEGNGKGKIYTGATVTGTVMSISENEIRLDLGAKVTGIITRDQITDENDVKLADMFKIGDEVDASVISVSDKDGIAILSKKKVDGVKNWNKIVEYAKTGETVNGKIIEVTKGGLVALVDSVKVFVPASMTGTAKDEDLSKFAGTTQQLKIVEIKEDRKRAIGSIKAVIRELKKANEEKFWNEIEEGKVYEGPVKSLTSYGAFVDLGGIDGLVHITELSWKRIKHPSEVVKVGDVIKVFVKSFDKETKRVSLGYKTEEENPWTIFNNKYAVNDVADVKIVGITSFGAFAEIVPGVDGLIHISQIADRKIDSVASVLKVGDVCEAKIIDIDDEKKKVSLSIRALLESETTDEASGDEEAAGEVESAE